MKQDLNKVFFFSATTDLWSSGAHLYISYTMHYVTDWKLESSCLQTHFLPEDHTGENLAEAKEATLAAWDLTASRQVCLTTDDNATNCINAAEQLQWSHLSCFSHNLHLAITKAIKADRRCERCLVLCRKIVSALSMSWKRKRDLTKAQMNLQSPVHTLVADSLTKWGSMAKMVAQILEQENVIRTVLTADRKALTTWQDIHVPTAIHQALSPLSDLTDIFSGEEYVTMSAILPLLRLIEKKLIKDEASDTQLTKDIKQDLSSCYTIPKISTMVLRILQVATFLDPLLKCHFNDDTDVADIKETLQEESAKVIQCTLTSQPSKMEGSSSSAVAGLPPAKKCSLGSFFKDAAKETQPVLSPEQQVKAEVVAYEAFPKLDPEGHLLQWWKVQSPRFPGLCKPVQSY